MSNLSNVNPNLSLVKQSYRNMLALGEGANGADFRMVIEEYGDLEYLIQSTQWPTLAREMMEGKGPHGVSFNQQGNVKNAGDITITFKEVVTGKAIAAVIDWVKNKKYLSVTLAQISESQPESNEYTTVTMEDCWLEMDVADMSVDDGATLFKRSGTLHYNWPTSLDDEQETLGWE